MFKQIPVNSTKVSGSQTDFPVFVQPSAITGLGALTLAEAQSARFYSDEAKTTELAREVVSADEIHVKTNLSSSTILYIDYDGVRSDYAVTATYGAEGVWTNGYAGVWHMNSVNPQDSTANGNNGSAENGLTSDDIVNGKLGKAISFGGGKIVRIPEATSLEPARPLTISAVFNANSWTVGHNRILDKGAWGGELQGYALGTESNSANFFGRYYGGDYRDTEDGVLTTGVWHISHYVIGQSEQSLFVNGGVAATTNHASSVDYGKTTDLTIGARTDYEQPFDGTVSEIRIASVERVADWISIEYSNQNSPSTFFDTATDVNTATVIKETGTFSSGAYSLDGTNLDPDTQYYFRAYAVNSEGKSYGGQESFTTALAVQNYSLTTDKGTYTLTGYEAYFTRTYNLACDTANYQFSGNALDINRHRSLTAETARYTLTGNAVTLSTTRRLEAEKGSYTLTGSDTQITLARTLTADTGEYEYTGNALETVHTRAIKAETASFVLTGYSSFGVLTGSLVARHGNFVLTGGDLKFTRKLREDLETGSYAFVGNDAEITRVYTLKLETGSFALNKIAGTTLTIDHTKVSATLTDFPVYVDISSLGLSQAKAERLRVKKADGTELPREIVSANEMHLKADTLSDSQDTALTLSYADEGASDYAVTATYGAQNVWTNGYKGVYHITPASTTQALDSTSNNKDAVLNNISASDFVDGKMGKALSMNGVDQFISGFNMIGIRSLSLHAKTPVTSGGNKYMVSARPGLSKGYFSSSGFETGWENYYVDGQDHSNVARGWQEFEAWDLLSKTEYNHIYLSAVSLFDTLVLFDYFGSASGYNLEGEIDEIRINSAERSVSWSATEHANQNSPSTFYTLAEGGTSPQFSFEVHRVLKCSSGSFVQDANDATFTRALKLKLETGSYTLTGNAIAFSTDISLSLETGNYTLAGNDASLIAHYVLSAESGTFALSGNDTTITVTKILSLESADFAFSGQDIDLRVTYQLEAETTAYALSGGNAELSVARHLNTETASYEYSGNDANLARIRLATLETGTYTMTETDADLIVSRYLDLEPASFTLNGVQITLAYDRTFDLMTSSYVLVGNDLDISRLVDADYFKGETYVTRNDNLYQRKQSGYTRWDQR